MKLRCGGNNIDNKICFIKTATTTVSLKGGNERTVISNHLYYKLLNTERKVQVIDTRFDGFQLLLRLEIEKIGLKLRVERIMNDHIHSSCASAILYEKLIDLIVKRRF
ncbi:hypothetical protein PPL_01242 [Heterostelium album PN500]|uniref:Uncharacterized protein n=1 Tax=Heterostelium pallidum (strain ATCC 26659 / Pp 5 / PN500) TaxID=670386 RepID=D3AYI2_HETP5|nr:hypothetical protein PPL_01242 [Heterostelium album PN500]EFA86009.1 hypothetical protein PPL_01242 [Heterostelium album PN500]|eukprot:XP_020438115.1 hypothetical protein PPL_01242 [Heterostelium album PN500]